jgi:prepilin-type processing-associated H-X9-DG protein
MGMSIQQFALVNNGRGPGGATTKNGSFAWDNVLNSMIFKQPQHNGKGTRITLGEVQANTLGCPTFTMNYNLTKSNPTSNSGRALAINSYVTGGPYYTVKVNGKSVKVPEGQYGLMLKDPQSHQDYFKTYWLGSKLSKFKNTSQKFMILDHEGANDNVTSSWPHNDLPGTWYLGDDARYPRFAGDAGAYSFRHNGRRIMNVVFIDGHVEGLGPTAGINLTRRFAFTG